MRRCTARICMLATAVTVAAVAVAHPEPVGAGHPFARAAQTPQQLAAEVASNDAALREAIDVWRAAGDPPTAPPPEEVMTRAEYLQGVIRFLAAHPNQARETTRLLPSPLSRRVAALVAAARKLRKLSKGSRNPNLKTGEPPPLSELVGHYAKAKRRSGIHPKYLAAIHHVETKFGRVKSKSVAGAKGPMQFIPSTWRIYGKGGNIQDPHDAILAAARLLRANSAPRNYSRALYAYNPSKLYVRAVHIYARLIARDGHALYYLYCWGA